MERSYNEKKLRSVTNIIAIIIMIIGVVIRLLGYKAAIYVAYVICGSIFIVCDVKERKTGEKDFKYHIFSTAVFAFLAITTLLNL